MRTAYFLLTGLMALATSPLAQAQYEWLDDNGRHVFSDQVPPLSIPPERILSQPEPGRSAPARQAQTEEAAATDAQEAEEASASADPAPDASQQGQAQTDADADEQARKEAEARQQAVRADNCERAQQARRTLEAGMRIARVNEAGERVVLDEAQRAAELERANEVIASAC